MITKKELIKTVIVIVIAVICIGTLLSLLYESEEQSFDGLGKLLVIIHVGTYEGNYQIYIDDTLKESIYLDDDKTFTYYYEPGTYEVKIYYNGEYYESETAWIWKGEIETIEFYIY